MPCHKSWPQAISSVHSLTSAPLEGRSCSRKPQASFKGCRKPLCLLSKYMGLLPHRHVASQHWPNLLSDLLGEHQSSFYNERGRFGSYDFFRVKSWVAAFVVLHPKLSEWCGMYIHWNNAYGSSPAIRVWGREPPHPQTSLPHRWF